MTIYKIDKNIQWKLDQIRFLYPPDDFTIKVFRCLKALFFQTITHEINNILFVINNQILDINFYTLGSIQEN